MKWLRPVEGALAADSLIQAPRRTSATVAALMLSLALVVGQGGVARASLQSIDEWMNNTLNPDMFISTTENIASHGARFPAAMQQELESVPGVAEVHPVRMPRLQFHGYPVMLVSTQLARVGRRVKRHITSGDEESMNRLASQEQGVILSENLAALVKLGLGDTVELATPTGILRLPVVGTVRDLSNQMGAIFLERSAYIRYFQDDTVDLFRVYLTPGASQEEMRSRIIARLGTNRRMFVMLNRDVRAYIAKVMDQWFGLTYVQVIVAMLVAVLGIVNTLTVSISDRRRELGVLRAVGGLRAQIRGTVWMEAAAIGIIGLVLGIAAGAIMLYYELQAIHHDLSGMPFAYQFPWTIVAMLVPVILLAALGAAICPPRVRSAGPSWRHWNMNKAILLFALACPLFAQDARQIVPSPSAAADPIPSTTKACSKSPRGFQSHQQILAILAPRFLRRQQSHHPLHRPRRSERRRAAGRQSSRPLSDQWMWTPAIARDRRIALQDRSTRFFGTDSASKIWKSATSISTTTASPAKSPSMARPAGASNAARAGKTSQYTLSRIWIRKDNYVPAQYENYIKDQPVRRLHQTDIRNVQGIWTPCTLEMADSAATAEPCCAAEAGIQHPYERGRFHRPGAAARPMTEPLRLLPRLFLAAAARPGLHPARLPRDHRACSSPRPRPTTARTRPAKPSSATKPSTS